MALHCIAYVGELYQFKRNSFWVKALDHRNIAQFFIIWSYYLEGFLSAVYFTYNVCYLFLHPEWTIITLLKLDICMIHGINMETLNFVIKLFRYDSCNSLACGTLSKSICLVTLFYSGEWELPALELFGLFKWRKYLKRITYTSRVNV